MALLWTPILTKLLYKYKAWRKDDRETRKVPRMGGLLIWITVAVLGFVLVPSVWIPLVVLIVGSLVGLVDDLLCIRPWKKKDLRIRGLRFTWRMMIVLLVGVFAGGLLINNIGAPVYYLAFVPLVMIIIFGGAPIDGLDGLSAGVMIPMFASYSIISFAQGNLSLSIFAGLIVGALLAFLYFNIPPARFFMGETGMIGLLPTLTILAFLTDTVLYLPIIALPLIVTAGSILLQIFSFQVFGKRVFKVAPLHHHFEKLGWPHYKITMRYWVFAVAFAFLGTALSLIA